MQINKVKRPWQPKYKSRVNSNNPFYHSKDWKSLRQQHIDSYTQLSDGTILSNKYCIRCFIDDNKLTPMHTVDHIIPIRKGGSKTDPQNLQSLCLNHNAIKTAKDGQ